MDYVFGPPLLRSMDVTEYDLVPQLADISIRDISADSLKVIITEWINDRIKKFNDSFIKLNKIIKDKNLKVFEVKNYPVHCSIDGMDSAPDDIISNNLDDFTVEDLIKLIETHNVSSIAIYNDIYYDGTDYADTDYKIIDYNDKYIDSIITVCRDMESGKV